MLWYIFVELKKRLKQQQTHVCARVQLRSASAANAKTAQYDPEWRYPKLALLINLEHRFNREPTHNTPWTVAKNNTAKQSRAGRAFIISTPGEK